MGQLGGRGEAESQALKQDGLADVIGQLGQLAGKSERLPDLLVDFLLLSSIRNGEAPRRLRFRRSRRIWRSRRLGRSERIRQRLRLSGTLFPYGRMGRFCPRRVAGIRRLGLAGLNLGLPRLRRLRWWRPTFTPRTGRVAVARIVIGDNYSFPSATIRISS